MSSSIRPSIFSREKPLELLLVNSDEFSAEECGKSSGSEILSVDFFEDMLDENLDEKIQKLEKALRATMLNKTDIDHKAIEQEKHIKGLNSKLKNCKGKKAPQKRQSYTAQIKLEGDLLEGLKTQAEQLKELISKMESRMSSLVREKI